MHDVSWEGGGVFKRRYKMKLLSFNSHYGLSTVWKLSLGTLYMADFEFTSTVRNSVNRQPAQHLGGLFACL